MTLKLGELVEVCVHVDGSAITRGMIGRVACLPQPPFGLVTIVVAGKLHGSFGTADLHPVGRHQRRHFDED